MAVKPDAIPAILIERRSSPFNRNNLPNQVPEAPIICTKGASGPRLPPEPIHSKEDKSMDGLFLGSNFPLSNRMLFTINLISPGWPIKLITKPASRPQMAMVGITNQHSKDAK